MSYRNLFLRLLILIIGVAPMTSHADLRLQTAEAFIDAFYAFDPDRLRGVMKEDADTTAIFYYQGWAEGAHYAVKTRRACTIEDEDIVCAITVTDDFGRAMGYEATDTFRMSIEGDRVAAVTFTGDDPPIFGELQAWISTEKPEIFQGPCLDLFAGGKTPHACAEAVAEAAIAFMASRAATP